MANKPEPLVQIIVLSILVFVLILSVIGVYFYRYALFGPSDLTVYGTYGDIVSSPCQVENKTDESTRCTDVGTFTQTTSCIQNPNTGRFCWNGSEMNTTSLVRVSQCTPACTLFRWVTVDTTPCMIETKEPIIVGSSTIEYKDPSANWCNPIVNSVRFVTKKCQSIDGSGINTCLYTCSVDTFNPDCFTSPDLSNGGTTIMYNPAIVPVNDTQDLVQVGDIYMWTPVSKADVAFPVIASSIITIKEPCDSTTQLSGQECGSFQPSTTVDGKVVPDDAPSSRNTLFTENCPIMPKIEGSDKIGYPPGGTLPYDYNAANVNTIYDMFEPGISERLLTCFSRDDVPDVRCDPDVPGCVLPEDIFDPDPTQPTLNNINRLIPLTSEPPAQICALAIRDGQGIVTDIIKNASILNPCLFTQPDFSLNPNANLDPTSTQPLIDPTFQFDTNAGIFGVPLFMKHTEGNRIFYLSVYNTPCPTYTVTTNTEGKHFDFSPEGGFIAPPGPIPTTGIPFRFDCKGNPLLFINYTPTTLIEDITPNPANNWGIEPACNTRSLNVSPVIEQTALMLMFRPAKLDDGEIVPINSIKVNIFAVFGSNYVGWLRWQFNFPGYQNDTANGPVLTWFQGRLDPYGDTIVLPGTRIEDEPTANFYLTKVEGLDFTYTLNFINFPIRVLDSDSTLYPILGNITFQRATSQGVPIITTFDGNNSINDPVFTDFSYASQNRGSNSDFPVCNIMYDPNQNI